MPLNSSPKSPESSSDFSSNSPISMTGERTNFVIHPQLFPQMVVWREKMKETIFQLNLGHVWLSEKPTLPVYQNKSEKETFLVFAQCCELIGQSDRSSQVSNSPFNFVTPIADSIL
jgi:hypothetical protein